MSSEDPQGHTGMVAEAHKLKNSLSNAFEGGVGAASVLVKSGTAFAKEEVEKASGVAQTWYASCLSGLSQADEAMISSLRSGVDLAREHENATIAGALGLAAIILPAPRRLLWRLTLGRFQSAEAAQRSAELKVASLSQRITEQEGEVKKLTERLDMARSEYARGLSKLQGAASELRGLTQRMQATEKKSSALMEDLRELRSKHALQLRSNVAVMSRAAALRQAEVEKLVFGLSKDGF